MSEYIKRQDAISAAWEILNGLGYSEKHNDRLVEDVDAVFDEAVEEDVKPVVLCKDCKWTKTDDMDDPAIYCKKWDRWDMPPDGFCFAGRKRGTA